jgi:hypothetical protein
MKFPIIIYKIAEPKTCWWSNIRRKKSKEHIRQRQDMLFGITRSYHRNERKYIYRLTIGRFTIGIMFQ